MSDDEFEVLVAAICYHVLGTGTIIFAAGRDGGRDGTFTGTAAKFPSPTSPLTGKFIVQAKHTQNPVASCADAEFGRTLVGEHPKITELIKKGELEHYLLFTNRKKPAGDGTKKEKALKGLGLASAHLLGMEQLRLWLNRFVKLILGINGEFIVSRNASGNIEFEIRTKDVVGTDTSQDQGHSYHRLLCALFDLAMLRALEKTPFYHFVYHDGIFEGLDNRVKVRLLSLIKEIIGEGRIQYILSIIDADLPRDAETQQQIQFAPDEIVLNLNDQGDKGRLFKMPPF